MAPNISEFSYNLSYISCSLCKILQVGIGPFPVFALDSKIAHALQNLNLAFETSEDLSWQNTCFSTQIEYQLINLVNRLIWLINTELPNSTINTCPPVFGTIALTKNTIRVP